MKPEEPVTSIRNDMALTRSDYRHAKFCKPQDSSYHKVPDVTRTGPFADLQDIPAARYRRVSGVMTICLAAISGENMRRPSCRARPDIEPRNASSSISSS